MSDNPPREISDMLFNQSLEKGLAVLRAFNAQRRTMTLAEVAEATRHRAHTRSAPFHQRAVSRHRFTFAAPSAARTVKSASPAAQARAAGRSPAS